MRQKKYQKCNTSSVARSCKMRNAIKKFLKDNKSKIDLLLGVCYIFGVPYYIIGLIYIGKYFI